MSYILDALQKSDADENPVTVYGTAPTPNPGLALGWKLAIGAVLAANLVLLYLWRTDREPAPQIAQQSAAEPQTQQPRPVQTAPRSTPPKKTLPGIASPRPLPPPSAQQARATNSGSSNNTTARTFKPRGAPITIAERDGTQNGAGQSAPSTQPRATKPRTPPQATRQPNARASSSRTSTSPSRLSQLSNGAREALYVLTFSTHIYGSDSDLRAVVVNGERLTEGNSITAENGQEFLLREITDNGVIMQFEHEGTTESVAIPVMEDWKDA